jgi:hypothetical protein
MSKRSDDTSIPDSYLGESNETIFHAFSHNVLNKFLPIFTFADLVKDDKDKIDEDATTRINTCKTDFLNSLSSYQSKFNELSLALNSFKHDNKQAETSLSISSSIEEVNNLVFAIISNIERMAVLSGFPIFRTIIVSLENKRKDLDQEDVSKDLIDSTVDHILDILTSSEEIFNSCLALVSAFKQGIDEVSKLVFNEKLNWFNFNELREINTHLKALLGTAKSSESTIVEDMHFNH